MSETDAEEAAPRSFGALRVLIAHRRDSLPRRLVQVAEFALAQPEAVAFGTTAEVAAQAGVQPSTLVRFAQALGYAGFSDLQAVFRSHARGLWPDYRERLEALRGEGEPGALLAGFVQASSESLARLQSTVDLAALSRAVDLLARAGCIHLLGTRRAFPVVAYLSYALCKLGVRCQVVDQAGGLAPERLDLVPAGDAVLAVSFTPYAPSTLDLASRAFRRGVPVVAITDTPFSPLAQVATVWLEVAEADHAAFRSLAGTFALTMTLAVAVAERLIEDGT